MSTLKEKFLHPLVILLVVAQSCDVPGKIIINNSSGEDATFKYEIFTEDDSLESNIIRLGTDAGENKAVLLFGFGHRWTDERIKEYLEKVSYIEIISHTDSIRLNNKDEMFDFFESNRHGLFLKTVKIQIN